MFNCLKISVCLTLFTVVTSDLAARQNQDTGVGSNLDDRTRTDANCNSDCGHGECIHQNDKHYCDCKYGWRGIECDFLASSKSIKIGEVKLRDVVYFNVTCEEDECIRMYGIVTGEGYPTVFFHDKEIPRYETVGHGKITNCLNDGLCFCERGLGKLCRINLPYTGTFFVAVVSASGPGHLTMSFIGEQPLTIKKFVDPCNPKCIHGECEGKKLGYKCRCNEGWEGDACDVESKQKRIYVGELEPGFQKTYAVACNGPCGKFFFQVNGQGETYVFGDTELPEIGPGARDYWCKPSWEYCSCNTKFGYGTMMPRSCIVDIIESYYYVTVKAYDGDGDVMLWAVGINLKSITEVVYQCEKGCVNGQCRPVNELGVNVCFCEFGWEDESCSTRSERRLMDFGKRPGGSKMDIEVTCDGPCLNIHIERLGPHTYLFANRDEIPDVGDGPYYYDCDNDQRCDCELTYNYEGKKCPINLPLKTKFYVTATVTGRRAADAALLFSGKNLGNVTLIPLECNPKCQHGNCLVLVAKTLCDCFENWGGPGCTIQMLQVNRNLGVLPAGSITKFRVECPSPCGTVEAIIRGNSDTDLGNADIYGSEGQAPYFFRNYYSSCYNSGPSCYCKGLFDYYPKQCFGNVNSRVTFFAIRAKTVANVTLSVRSRVEIKVVKLEK